jgi:hypothetical protein
MMLVEI